MTPNSELRAYMAYSRSLGPEEGAILTFAHNVREAKRLSFPTVSEFYDGEWIDLAVRWLKDKHIFSEADQEKLKLGIPHVIDNPTSCVECEQWGKLLTESGRCEECEELHYTEPIRSRQ